MKGTNGLKLKSLILNRNNLQDGGLQILALGLFERYQIFENISKNTTQTVLPIQYLGLSGTGFTDHVTNTESFLISNRD